MTSRTPIGVPIQAVQWALLAGLVLLAMGLAACGGGSSGDSGSSSMAACGSATTCTNAMNATYAGASTTLNSISSAGPVSGGPGGCIAGSATGTTPNFTASLTLTSCNFVNGADHLMVNGSVSVVTSSTAIMVTSPALSVSGVVGGDAVSFSCAVNITVTVPGGSVSGTVCGQAIAGMSPTAWNVAALETLPPRRVGREAS